MPAEQKPETKNVPININIHEEADKKRRAMGLSMYEYVEIAVVRMNNSIKAQPEQDDNKQ